MNLRLATAASLASWLLACGGRIDASSTSLDRADKADLPGETGVADALPPPAVAETGTPPSGPESVACWSVPAVVRPAKSPTLGVAEACATSVGTATQVAETARANLVGRWLACSTPAYGGAEVVGIEVSGTLRWRMLGHDAAGLIVPRSDLGVGRVKVLDDSAQINFEMDGGSMWIAFAAFTADASAMRLDGAPKGGARYARIAAAPDNGADNQPSLSDGRCAMVGTWEFQSGGGGGSLSFDAAGNWIGGSPRADLCASHTMNGTYALRPGLLEFVTIENPRSCGPTWGMGWAPSFDADCTHLTLSQTYDNCTGGRAIFNGVLSLTRR